MKNIIYYIYFEIYITISTAEITFSFSVIDKHIFYEIHIPTDYVLFNFNNCLSIAVVYFGKKIRLKFNRHRF